MKSIDDCQFRFVEEGRLNERAEAHDSTILNSMGQSESENGGN
jgi:hypothetical protein